MYIIAPASAMHHFARIERDFDELHLVAEDFVVDDVAPLPARGVPERRSGRR